MKLNMATFTFTLLLRNCKPIFSSFWWVLTFGDPLFGPLWTHFFSTLNSLLFASRKAQLKCPIAFWLGCPIDSILYVLLETYVYTKVPSLRYCLLAAASKMRSTSEVSIPELSRLRWVRTEPGVGRETASALGTTSPGLGDRQDGVESEADWTGLQQLRLRLGPNPGQVCWQVTW